MVDPIVWAVQATIYVNTESLRVMQEYVNEHKEEDEVPMARGKSMSKRRSRRSTASLCSLAYSCMTLNSSAW
eukprot:CAMPEP_0195011100 /NCGR_PEP_ID=MMETSP0326_2-20130528/10676_1 /TAXON_ID=2866 ORGANISM="Crypthecodinium cohnii, Strain Seligo" /NCGR_SAMPLE_ID=MMETSP0326_2 /ASSEMBLY_ACC=CAM_ASM_000348 /LENGTH=71 /DNA_ID=CAMNT_0040020069 /DNA_START=121 /DNA_END=333 /DNA_ORIENTATION=-